MTGPGGHPRVLFRDSRFVVIDKPAGLPVHAGPSGSASVEDWFPALSRRKDGPWLVHRLDADTAGCLVIALRRAALLAAQREFASRRARKTYWAVVRGRPQGESGGESGGASGVVDVPLLRRSAQDGWRIVIDPAGQRAVTAWQVLGHGDGWSWLALTPRTGRTHQIRVHCAALGCPILGDARYGGGAGGLHLLSRAIELMLDPPVSAVAEPPPAMLGALRRCGFTGIDAPALAGVAGRAT